MQRLCAAALPERANIKPVDSASDNSLEPRIAAMHVVIPTFIFKQPTFMTEPYGCRSPGFFDRTIIAATSRLPNNWLGLRLAIGLRRAVTMRMHGDDGFDVERWGMRLRLYPRRNGCEKGVLFTPQMFEVPERAELSAGISQAKTEGRDFVFIDVGANVGMFSFLVAAEAGSSVKILAIEPEAENLRRLRFNIAANSGVPIKVIPTALGSTNGNVIIETDSRDRGGTRVLYKLSESTNNTATVNCRTLLEVLRESNISSIDALKIDVEGSEDEILVPFFKSAQSSLWPRLVIIEDAHEIWRTNLFSFLTKYGYSISTRSKLNVMMRLRRPDESSS